MTLFISLGNRGAIFFFAGAFIVAANVHAASREAFDSPPVALDSGSYRFTGEIEPTLRLRREIVLYQTPEGNSRLAQLKTEGFECRRAASGRDLCTKRYWGEPMPEELESRVRGERHRLGDVTLGPLAGEPSLISQGDLVVEWSFPQSLSFAGRGFVFHRRLVSGAVDKIRAGDLAAGLGTELVVKADDGTGATSLRAMVSAVRTKGALSDEFIGYAIYRAVGP